MLTHVHKMIHLVVGTFEQGLGNFTSGVCKQSNDATGALDRKDGGHYK